MIVLGVTADERELDEWAVVLAAEGIPYRLEQTPASMRLLVAATDAARATAALDAYGRDERKHPSPPLPAAEYGPTLAGVAMALVLVACYLTTGPRGAEGVWFRAGSADAGRIRAGELWRAVTALTLHADASHLIGNLAGTVVFVSAVARALGPGLASVLVLLAGAAGNIANALLHAGNHRSVGASTAVFGAVGILGGLAAVRRQRTRRRWVPIAGSLALLAMLGSDVHADLGAHALGLLLGLVLGLGAGTALSRPPVAALQWSLALAAGAAVVVSWTTALG